MNAAAALQTAMSKPVTGGTANLTLQRKCACGGSAGLSGECAECSKKKHGLQSKFVVRASDDPLEWEADRIAEQVISASAGHAVRATSSRIQRTSGPSNGQTGAAPASVDRVLADAGRPLEPELRQDMERRFGYDFSKVRVHSDAAAGQSACSIDAHAYTSGSHIVFGAGRYAPGTPWGRRLLAHELAHVVQQSALGTGSAAQSVMRKGFESTVQVCHRVLESRKFEVSNGGVRVVVVANSPDKGVPNCRDFDFGVTLTRSEDWWPDKEIGTCEASTGGARTFKFTNIPAGVYYLTFWRVFDHPYCCLEGDVLVYDEPVTSEGEGCHRARDLSAMDIVHGALDIAGFIPVLGAIPDGVNAAIYVVEGDWANAGLSAVAMVPAWGDGVKLATMGGKAVIRISGKAAVKLGPEGIAKGLKAVEKASKAEKAVLETTEEAAKLAKAEKGAAEGAVKAEKESGEAAAKAEKEAAEKEAAQEKGKEKRDEKEEKREKTNTCATQFPAAINCTSLLAFTFPSAQSALIALKVSTDRKNLRLASPAPSTGGPCPGTGMHYGVKDGGTYIASISCCPCCIDTPSGPRIVTRCRII